MKSREDYKKEKFDICMALGFTGLEIGLSQLPEKLKKWHENELVRDVHEKLDILSMREGKDEIRSDHYPFYKKIKDYIEKLDKKVFWPYEHFEDIWSDDDLKIFSEIILPSCDFFISDILSSGCIREIISDKARELGLPMLFLDEKDSIFDKFLVRCGTIKLYKPSDLEFRSKCPAYVEYYFNIGDDEPTESPKRIIKAHFIKAGKEDQALKDIEEFVKEFYGISH